MEEFEPRARGKGLLSLFYLVAGDAVTDWDICFRTLAEETVGVARGGETCKSDG